MVTKVCATCGAEKDRDQFPSSGWYTTKIGIRIKLLKPDCKLCHNKRTLIHFDDLLKQIGVELKCVRCGYDRCSANIDFHHTDPKQKDFTISSRPSVSLTKLQSEINKCIILCKICHGELHAGLWQLTNLGC